MSVDAENDDKSLMNTSNSVEEQLKQSYVIKDQVEPTKNLLPVPAGYYAKLGPPMVAQFNFKYNLTHEEAKSYLSKYVDSLSNDDHPCCGRKKFMRDLSLKNVIASTSLFYKLLTFYETRSTGIKRSALKGGFVDGPEYGRPPLPWEIPVVVPPAFSDGGVDIPVPHTSYSSGCNFCLGQGRIVCRSCQWKKKLDFPCYVCNDRRQVSCTSCNGSRIMCSYINLSVHFKTVTSEWTYHRSDMPDCMVSMATSSLLFQDTQPLLRPITSFPEPVVAENFRRIFSAHELLASVGRIWMQSHSVLGVPVFQCDYVHNGEDGTFWVYGEDRNVYAPYLPDSYCMACCRSCDVQ